MGAVDERKTRRNYPERVELPASRPASDPAPAGRGPMSTPRTVRVDISPKGGAGYRAGRFIENVVGDAKRDAGSAVRQVVNAVLPVAGPAAGAVASLLGNQSGRVGLRNFFDGLTGSPEGGTKTLAAAPVAALKAANPVAAALEAGRAAPESPLTPQELMLAHLDTLMSRPMTQRGMQAASGVLAETQSQRVKLPTSKDNLLGETAQASKAVYESQIKDILARRTAGELDQVAAEAATGKATEGFINRNSGLLGNNILSYMQANMLPQPDPEDQ